RGGPTEPGVLVVGYMALAGAQKLARTPFGMVWHRAPSRSEVASAKAYVQRMRVWDSSAGQQPAAGAA
ncbi:MAG: hypothetical protein MUF54_24005, partial [Polyangiaceae bacterium]|nr:hypothetical protein [Polyangiaceae bacterium]